MTKILQIDREAGQLLYDRISNPSWNSATMQPTREGQRMLDGKADGSPFVVIAASHREQATRQLVNLLEEAALQIEYLNDRWPTGSSETAITRIRSALTKANPDA